MHNYHVEPSEFGPSARGLRGAPRLAAALPRPRIAAGERREPVEDGEPADMLAILRKGAERGLIDQPIFIARKSGGPLALRLVAVKKSPQAAEIARRKARKQAAKGRHQVSKGTLIAAEWVIIVTSLALEAFTTEDVLALYRLRWRIELAFKRLKSLIGLKGPPGTDERSAKPYLLAHLLMILLLEPLVDAFEDSPRWALAA